MLQEEQKAERDWRYNPISKIKYFTRIKTSKAFNGVYRHATKTWHTPYFVLFYQKTDSYQVGFVASKKIGNAVHRNRAKRLLRAHFIAECDRLGTGAYVLVAKPALLNEPYEVTHKAFFNALRKSRALIQRSERPKQNLTD